MIPNTTVISVNFQTDNVCHLAKTSTVLKFIMRFVRCKTDQCFVSPENSVYLLQKLNLMPRNTFYRTKSLEKKASVLEQSTSTPRIK